MYNIVWIRKRISRFTDSFPAETLSRYSNFHVQCRVIQSERTFENGECGWFSKNVAASKCITSPRGADARALDPKSEREREREREKMVLVPENATRAHR